MYATVPSSRISSFHFDASVRSSGASPPSAPARPPMSLANEPRSIVICAFRAGVSNAPSAENANGASNPGISMENVISNLAESALSVASATGVRSWSSRQRHGGCALTAPWLPPHPAASTAASAIRATGRRRQSRTITASPLEVGSGGPSPSSFLRGIPETRSPAPGLEQVRRAAPRPRPRAGAQPRAGPESCAQRARGPPRHRGRSES